MNPNDMKAVRRAIISVSDKTGVVEFARALAAQNIEILSTGGTYRLLRDNALSVREVSDYTGFAEMMDGRVKTLHPRVHGGILGRRGIDDETMKAEGIEPIDLVAVNLYPFEQTVAQPDCSLEQAIETIDIGGPAMLRAAAKNQRDVTVLVDAADYQNVVEELNVNGGMISAETRYRLAVKAFAHTAGYDGAIANYLSAGTADGVRTRFPESIQLQFRKAMEMRYGENPHQSAAFYVEKSSIPASIASAKQIQGKALSYNNIADTDAALECVTQFDQATCVIVKHANPCGVATGNSPFEAYGRAYATDPESAFGGIIAFNRPLDASTAQAIIDRQFVEVIIAPAVADAAIEIVAAKRNVRLLTCGDLVEGAANRFDFKRVNGGMLLQDNDAALYKSLEVVSQRTPDESEMRDLLFAWKVAKFVKSNAIVYASGLATIGVGAGQMSRVNSARIAAIKAEHAGLSVDGAVMASDAFFPFRDSIDNAATSGIRAVIQPGGSVRDAEVIESADEHGMAMVFTGMRHFRH